MLDRGKLARLTHICEKFWDHLSPTEREAYYVDNGVIGFIEDCMTILRIYPSEISVEQVNHICDQLLDTRKGNIYGSYIPTDDMTVIFEEFFNDDGEPEELLLRGFYYGSPNDADNKAFYKDYEAFFD